jgi:hypothetical protein
MQKKKTKKNKFLNILFAYLFKNTHLVQLWGWPWGENRFTAEPKSVRRVRYAQLDLIINWN